MIDHERSSSSLNERLDSFFELTKNGTTVQTEILGGFTTFLMMAYIIFVNPAILSKAGMPFEAVFVATCFAAAISTLIMALYANNPIALAPGMGLNAFFAFTVVVTYGYTWQEALACVFFSGVFSVILSVLPVRKYIINAIPKALKLAISSGTGFFLAIVAFSNAGVIVGSSATLVTRGDFASPSVMLTFFGFVLVVGLNFLKVPAATVIGILGAAIAGIPFGVVEFQGVFSAPPSGSETLLALDFGRVAEGSFWMVVLSMLFIDLFDTAGTLISVAYRGGLIGEDGKLRRVRKALLADSLGTVVGALIGTSNTTSYIESVAGVSSGARTGLASIVTASCFLGSLFFSPLAVSIPAYATSSALLFVAVIMASGLAQVNWDDLTDAAPAVITAIVMPLTYSIATGIAVGFILYVLIKLVTGRFQDLTVGVILMAVMFSFMLVFI